MREQAKIERYIEFIAAALQVPSFLIIRNSDLAGDTILTDPLYENLLRYWFDSPESDLPSPQMQEFVFSLASGLRAFLYCDNQLAAHKATGRNASARSVTGTHIQIMTSWMQATPMGQIAELTSSWLRMIDAKKATGGADIVVEYQAVDRRS